MPPDVALLSTLNGSNYPSLELIFMVSKVFEPLKFDYFHRQLRSPQCHMGGKTYNANKYLFTVYEIPSRFGQKQISKQF